MNTTLKNTLTGILLLAKVGMIIFFVKAFILELSIAFIVGAVWFAILSLILSAAIDEEEGKN